MMQRIREITAEEENFRLEPFDLDGRGHIHMVRRDPIKPVPEGTIILIPFRVTGYDRDCDGSLMARLQAIGLDGDESWTQDHIGLYPSTGLVVTEDELHKLTKETP